MSAPCYISVTDITDAAQTAELRSIFDERHSGHLFAAGVMMSHDTLTGVKTKWSAAYPPKKRICEIMVPREGVMNVLHYADYKDRSFVGDWLSAAAWAGDGLSAIQFDMIWPNPELLAQLKGYLARRKRPPRFIIQVGRAALDRCDGNPRKVAMRLADYHRLGCADYALLDMSGGTGQDMDWRQLIRLGEEVVTMVPDLNLAFAGGLGPRSMGLVAPALEHFATRGVSISLDAQSKLRPSGSALDPLDMEMACEYVRQAIQCFHDLEPV